MTASWFNKIDKLFRFVVILQGCKHVEYGVDSAVQAVKWGSGV